MFKTASIHALTHYPSPPSRRPDRQRAADYYSREPLISLPFPFPPSSMDGPGRGGADGSPLNRRWPMVDDTVMLCDPDIVDAIRCEAGAADELNSRLVGRAVGRLFGGWICCFWRRSCRNAGCAEYLCGQECGRGHFRIGHHPSSDHRSSSLLLPSYVQPSPPIHRL